MTVVTDKMCAVSLPGNVHCPHEAIYVVFSPLHAGTARRYACATHLVQAIHQDMVMKTGVRVTMAVFEDEVIR